MENYFFETSEKQESKKLYLLVIYYKRYKLTGLFERQCLH